jgi:alkaline phosphatase
VVTSRITHATPACFSSHVVHRDLEDIIARHQIGDYSLGRQVDVLLGGGRCFFLPQNVPGSCRHDDVDVLKMANKNGFSYIQSRKEFDKLKPKAKLPLLGLFHLDHMNYEIDRDEKLEPSLAEMTTKTLDILTHATRNNDKGFFLMVEGSRIGE